MSLPPSDQARSELSKALKAVSGALAGLAAMSAVLNVLLLGGSFFMLLVYDRVLPSRSVSTLVGLVFMVAAAYLFQAVLEMIRGRMLVHIGSSVDHALRGRIYDIVVQRAVRAKAMGDGLQPVRDLDQVRAFLSGAGPTAFFDLPFLVLFLGVLFAFHPLIGTVALAGAVILLAMTLITDRLTKEPAKEVTALVSTRLAIAESSRRNAEVMRALGMSVQGREAWSAVSQKHLAANQELANIAGRMGAASRVLRLLLQSMVLAIGAYLVISGEATGGVIIASSILAARALAPVETVIANWRGLVAARQSWARLRDLLRAFPPETQVTPLPAPTASLAVEGLVVGPPGAERATAIDVNLTLAAGEALGIIGPSASGKSSLVRALVGVWAPLRGRVRLDGASLDQWSSQALGRHLGYLPQDVELFEGTVAQNIARFEREAPPDEILGAAQRAEVHELILRLPKGYETEIGPNGEALSGGQRQRIALARALYRNPFLVVLDEPNSNLDAEGEMALAQAIASIRQRGGIAVVVAHRPSALANVDKVLVMSEGRVTALGPKNEVLQKVLAPKSVPGVAGVA